jgi:hypothetical protein
VPEEIKDRRRPNSARHHGLRNDCASYRVNVVNFEQNHCCSNVTMNEGRPAEWGMTSIIPFISNGVFEPADIKVMSDAYRKAIENIHGFGRPNRIVGEFIASRIIALTQGGVHDPDRLCERALTACGFSRERVANIRPDGRSTGDAVVVQLPIPRETI